MSAGSAQGWVPVAVAAGATVAVALAGGLLTDIGPWYFSLRQPAWKPPDWAFGPIWTVVFTCAAASAVLAWRGAATETERARVIAAFTVNGILNVAWSALFFTLRRPDWALAEVVALWLSIALLIVVVRPLAQRSAWLLLPYIAWVSLAAKLNYDVVVLNGPFGR